MTEKLSITRLSGNLGAEIRGLSLADPSPAQIEEIKALLLEHLVLYFPEQHLKPDRHIAFGRHFGTLDAHPHLTNPKDH